jgi:hypothetical protein
LSCGSPSLQTSGPKYPPQWGRGRTAKFGYFTLIDNPPTYGARRRDSNHFFHEVPVQRPDDLGERSVVTGDAERCITHLKQMEEAGIEEVILYFNVGLYPHSETMGMMERFAREVLPAFTGG